MIIDNIVGTAYSLLAERLVAGTGRRCPPRFRLTPRDIEREGVRRMVTHAIEKAPGGLTSAYRAFVEHSELTYWEEPIHICEVDKDGRQDYMYYRYYIMLDDENAIRIPNFIEFDDDWVGKEAMLLHVCSCGEEIVDLDAPNDREEDTILYALSMP